MGCPMVHWGTCKAVVREGTVDKQRPSLANFSTTKLMGPVIYKFFRKVHLHNWYDLSVVNFLSMSKDLFYQTSATKWIGSVICRLTVHEQRSFLPNFSYKMDWICHLQIDCTWAKIFSTKLQLQNGLDLSFADWLYMSKDLFYQTSATKWTGSVICRLTVHEQRSFLPNFSYKMDWICHLQIDCTWAKIFSTKLQLQNGLDLSFADWLYMSKDLFYQTSATKWTGSVICRLTVREQRSFLPNFSYKMDWICHLQIDCTWAKIFSTKLQLQNGLDLSFADWLYVSKDLFYQTSATKWTGSVICRLTVREQRSFLPNFSYKMDWVCHLQIDCTWAKIFSTKLQLQNGLDLSFCRLTVHEQRSFLPNFSYKMDWICHLQIDCTWAKIFSTKLQLQNGLDLSFADWLYVSKDLFYQTSATKWTGSVICRLTVREQRSFLPNFSYKMDWICHLQIDCT